MTPSKPIIRPLKPEDKSAWADLWTAYLAFYETTLPQATFDLTFSRLIDPARTTQKALMAEVDGKLLGLVHYIFHAHNWSAEDVCYLQDLYVTPETRGIGLGRKLIEATYGAADANGTSSVYWMTQDFNTNARHLYDRVGVLTPFIKYGRPKP